MVGALEQVGAQVLERQVEPRQDAALVQQRAAGGVEDGLAVQARADAARVGMQEEAMARTVDGVVDRLRAARLASGPPGNVSVMPYTRPRTTRPGARRCGVAAYTQAMAPERDLFANFERMRREMDELFGDVFDRTGLAPRRRGGFSPAVDVFYETRPDPPRAVVQAELAGIDPDELTLEIEGRELVLAGHRRPADAEGRVYQQLEIDFGPFRRVIQLGADVVADEARATYRDGMLRIELPLAAPGAATRAACRSRSSATRTSWRRPMIEHRRPRRRRGARRRGRRAAQAVPGTLPVLPLRETVPLPDTLIAAGRRPGALGPARQRRAARRPHARHGRLARPRARAPGPDELYDVGVVGAIARMLKVPDGTLRILVQGGQRVRIDSWVQRDALPRRRDLRAARRRPASRPSSRRSPATSSRRSRAIVEAGPYLPEELQLAVANIDDPSALSHLIAGSLRLKTEEKQGLLEEVDVARRLRRLVEILARELEVISIGSEIQSQVQSEIDKGQREFVLRQQLEAIRKELGEFDESAAEANELREQLDAIALPEDVRRQADRELKRLESLPPQAAEHGVIRTYLEWIASLPWDKTTEDNLDLEHARAVLDEDHYDIEQVKDRILEFLAVRKLKPDARGSILCFVGPPGVGKTSLGRSIARALGRKFERISAGGVRDEAEIRGHRRTYIGAMPGTIIRALRDAGSNNPLFMIDEIDKMGADFRGDPASAMLEVLDPEQNATFRDHYLDVPFDLSRRHVHHHGQHARHGPRAAARPHGGHPARGLHRGGEARDRQALPRAAPDRAQRPEEVVDRDLRRARCARSSPTTRARPACATSSARSARSAARSRARSPSRRQRAARERTSIAEPDACASCSAARASTPRPSGARAQPGVATGLAWTPVGGDVLFVEATRDAAARAS